MCKKNLERIGANDVGQMIKELNHTKGEKKERNWRRERQTDRQAGRERERERNKTHLLWL